MQPRLARGRIVTGYIGTAFHGRTTLEAADGSKLVPAFDRGISVSGLAGPAKPKITIHCYVACDIPPDVLEFLAAHDIVTVRFVQERTAFGIAEPLEFVAVGCQLADARFVEADDGNSLDVELAADQFTGRLW